MKIKNTTEQDLMEYRKAEPKWKFLTMSMSMIKEEISQINHLTLYLKELHKRKD